MSTREVDTRRRLLNGIASERKVIGGQGLRTEGFVPLQIGTATDTVWRLTELALVEDSTIVPDPLCF